MPPRRVVLAAGAAVVLPAAVAVAAALADPEGTARILLRRVQRSP